MVRIPTRASILLVDNRPDDAVALETLLGPLQQNFVRTATGGEALRFLQENDVAAILLDLDVPDSFQTAMRIRQEQKTLQTPIIFLTAINSQAHFGQQYSLTGVDYIFKPVVPEILRSKVSALIELFDQRQEVRRQSALVKAERDFADAILDTVASVVLVLDSEGRILRVNRAFEEITGYTFDHVRGHLLIDYLEEREAAKEFFKQARGHNEFQEYWLVSKTRRRVSLCCTKLSKNFEGGYFVVTGRDVTELRQRTEELEGFTYSVSHDMRAPVRAIDGFTRILIEEYANSLNDEGRRLLEIVRQNTEKMGQLIDGLLALSRLGREKLILTDFDMTELARAAFEEQKAAGGGHRNISLTLEELPAAYGDKRLIAQVFHNLLANSIKFTRNEQAATIEVGCRPSVGEYVYFVRDNGVGFDMNHAQKLFGTFQRLHAATEFEGSGIGLATVRRIIERHGGRVWAEAETDVGATFYFSLPVREQRKAS
jgi:two-component system sensor kinase